MTRGIKIDSSEQERPNRMEPFQSKPSPFSSATSSPAHFQAIGEEDPAPVFAFDGDEIERVKQTGSTKRQRYLTEPSDDPRMPHILQRLDSEKSSSCSDVSKFKTKPPMVDQADGEDDVDGPMDLKGAGGKRFSLSSINPFKSKDKKGRSSDNVSEVSGMHKSITETTFDRVKTISRSFGKGIKKIYSSADVKQLNTPLSVTDKILSYPARVVGVFLLIANFTNDLKGYNRDRAELRDFFARKLGYKFIEVINCTQDAMYKAIDMARNEVKQLHNSGEKVNRLIVAILTHGEEKGIHTCADGGGFLKEKDANGKFKTTDLEDIIAKCKHDEPNLPELRGLPKLFLVQACCGDEIVRAAGGTGCGMVEQADGEEENFIYQPTLPVDTDLFVASATTKYNQAFVSDEEGSWFINSTLAVFRKMHKTTDIESMFKAVTFDVSERRKALRFKDGSEAVAAQVPVRQSTLRKNCLL